MSTPPAPLSPSSRVYTSPSQPEHTSLLSSSPLSHTSSSRTPDSPDSLHSASPSEVERRALSFLSAPAHPSLLLDPHSSAALREAGAIDALELPRRAPVGEGARKEAELAAVEFLRRALEGVEETSWMYHTPAPFDQPKPLSTKGSRAHEPMDDGLPQRDEHWADRAFNLAAYPDPTGAMTGVVSEVVQHEGEGEWDDDDGEQAGDDSLDNTFDQVGGTEAGGAVRPRRIAGRTGLVRGVSDLAVG